MPLLAHQYTTKVHSIISNQWQQNTEKPSNKGILDQIITKTTVWSNEPLRRTCGAWWFQATAWTCKDRWTRDKSERNQEMYNILK